MSPRCLPGVSPALTPSRSPVLSAASRGDESAQAAGQRHCRRPIEPNRFSSSQMTKRKCSNQEKKEKKSERNARNERRALLLVQLYAAVRTRLLLAHNLFSDARCSLFIIPNEMHHFVSLLRACVCVCALVRVRDGGRTSHMEMSHREMRCWSVTRPVRDEEN